MQSALQPYATAGVAIVGASLIAVTPVAAPLPDIHPVRDVALTAGGDLFGPFVEQYNTAADNASVLANNFLLAPGVGLQQFIANQTDFLNEVLADPSQIPDVVNQMQQNLSDVWEGLTLFTAGPLSGIGGGGDPVTDAVAARTLDGGLVLNPGGVSTAGHSLLFTLLPTFLPSSIDPDQIQPIINFLASPLSGIIIGTLGPFLAPWVALGNSISDGDGPVEILANTVGAFFNGADVNLDALVPLINSSGLLPEGNEINHMDFALGGLFTPGVVAAGANEVVDSNGDVVVVDGTNLEVPADGGSIFNSLGLNLDASLLGLSLTVDTPSQAIGPIGAWEGLSQIIGVLLGSGWSTKSTPAPAIPPLTGFSFPQVPDDFFDGSGLPGGAAASEFSDAITQLLGGGDLWNDFISDVF